MNLDSSHSPNSQRIPPWLFGLLFVGVWTLAGFTFSALTYASAVAENRPVSISFAVAMNLTRFYLWAILSLVLYRVTLRFPVGFRPVSYRNLLINIFAVFIFASIHQSTFLTVGWRFDPTLATRYSFFGNFYRATFLSGLYLNLLIALLIVITLHAFMVYRNYREGEMQRSQLIAELAQAELRALKMQLHPHFLFNALHSISALVVEDPPRANLMIARLGDFLRLTLDQSESMVPLREELEFLRCYLEIEQIRFQDRLTVEFEIENTVLNSKVPHLILQPLVENAIRHVVSPRSTATEIRVRARQVDRTLRLEVADNGPGINPHDRISRNGLGMKNVQTRLNQTYGQNHRFEIENGQQTGLTVVLEVPFET